MYKSLRIAQRTVRTINARATLSTTRITLASHVPSSSSSSSSDPAGVFHKDDFQSQDPYPLTGRTDPAKSAAGEDGIPMSEDLTPHAPIDRSHEQLETKRARLLWQSRKRGILETDLLLSTFAATKLQGMDMATLVLYDRLLDEPDWEIYYYATGKKAPPAQFRGTELMADLIQHVKNEEKETRRMPSLKDQSANYRADRATDGMRTKQGMRGDEKESSPSPPPAATENKDEQDTEDGQKEELKEKIKGEDRDPSVIAS